MAQASEEAMAVDTMGGRVHVRWDEGAQATPHGQIVFFAEFLATAGVFDRWVQGCPLRYSSPNASRPRDVLGTLMLGILAGSKRYAHIAGVRGDAVAAKALGLDTMVSEDSVRRALKAMAPEASEPWMRSALMSSVREALERPWILDIDATIKPLYGHQEGAEAWLQPTQAGPAQPRAAHLLGRQSAPGAQWVAVASSADGRVLAAATAGHQIHVSQDYGATWTARNTSQYWSAIAVSADGGRIVAAADGGTVDVSTDAGVTWSTRLGGAAWRGVAASADGRMLVAVGWNVPIHISDDFGVTWVTRESARLWNSVTSSADGGRIAAVAGDDPNAAVTVLDFIYASSDQGLTWTPRGAADGWIGVTSSTDETRLAAVADGYGSMSLWTSAPTPVSTTTSGTGGSITGRQYQAIELQNIGGGRFMVLGSIGRGFDAE